MLDKQYAIGRLMMITPSVVLMVFLLCKIFYILEAKGLTDVMGGAFLLIVTIFSIWS